LLEWAEIDFDVLVKETPESYPAGMAAAQVPVHIARNKALAVKGMVDPERILLAADTVVVLKDEIIGKPRDREDAIGILSRLAATNTRSSRGWYW